MAPSTTSDERPAVGGSVEVPGAAGLARSTAAMGALTAVSRGTGFLRIVVVTNVLGTTYLANTYQTANTVPNLLFELLAAGALQAVLIPTVVGLVDTGDRDEAARVVGSVLGLAMAVLASVVAAAMVAAPLIMRVMVADVDDAAVRDAEVALGTFFLFFFLPQVLLYAANVVATAVLNATGSFSLPAFAPTINNVVVIGTYVLFAAMRGGQPPSLDLATDEKLVLALGTTAGVIAFCAVPIAAAARRMPLWPRFEWQHPAVRRLGRESVWAVAFLALTQVLLAVMLQTANRREGAVAVFQLAWILYLLPHSLFTMPVMTTRFPSLSRQAAAGDRTGFAANLGGGLRSITFLTLPAAALMMALSWPLSRLVVHGDAAKRLTEIADAVAGFAPGIVGYGLLLFLTRGFYARRDARTPTAANAVVAVVGVALVLLFAARVSGADLVASMGLASALAQTVGAALLWARLHRLMHRDGAVPTDTVAATARQVVAAVGAGLVVWRLTQLVETPSVPEAAVLVIGGAVVGAALYLLLQSLFGGPSPVAAVRSLGAASRDPSGVRATG